MNLNQLKYFVSVATYKSFTQAAECHYMTQASITQQIKALEDQLETELINRQKRPIELTPAGQVFYQEAKAILARADGAIIKTQEAAKGRTGTLRIGYEKGYERSDLSDRLRSFHRKYPGILFSCVREDTDSLSHKLMTDELDVIFSWDSNNLKENTIINSSLDMHSRLCVALPENHALANKNSLNREDLKNEIILYYSPSGAGNSYGDVHFMKLYERSGYNPNILIKSNDIESVLMMVAAEEGVAIVASFSVNKLNNAEGLRFVLMDGEEEYEDIHMIWKASSSNSALQCFVESDVINREKCEV